MVNKMGLFFVCIRMYLHMCIYIYTHLYMYVNPQPPVSRARSKAPKRFLESYFESGSGCWAGLGWVEGLGWRLAVGWAGLAWGGLGWGKLNAHESH